jgi:hypothetical protein
LSYDGEFGALLGRLAAEWDEEDNGPVAWPNRKFDPPDPSDVDVWIRPTVLPGVASQVSLGDAPRYRHPGLLVVQVFSPLGVGDGAMRRAADRLMAIYRLARVEGFRFRAPYLDPVGPGETWFQANVVVPYERDETFREE